MFEYVKGQLVSIYPTYVVVEVHGVGYQIFMPNAFGLQEMLKQDITVYVYQAVREDAITLYGFKSLEEKQLFLKLISVSGIGPKSALSILASDNSEGLIQAIETNDITYLTKFPGVGKKTAAQIVLDLKGKFTDISKPVLENHIPVLEISPILAETKEALLGLGYSEREIKKVLPQLEKEHCQSTDQALRIAFKLLLGSK
ncbi:Holliday junction branch migration protein RuvA [Granulicatella sp. zg-ZJ]|uniref:Holliday junction branch migration protein RuvA n=1 Tax=Granulicatella sp. zg-ZJ TaxID=2678504 RepID=UPI0013D1F3B7|nr:Holliday junction branch migration protein RuvA [Granulicatella sp. zg-ZJ]MBS4750921.1 Holliday junction branch migration protein RuvA [Carnobacteriaceae bacterium zg-ZUI78]NEW62771.1 Holliday junction branch migration protein RuvA [Granulicatella sp. zg-ZJ]